MSMRDLIHGEAELDDEENDESFDEETGEPIPGKSRTNGELDDSSEEEEAVLDEEDLDLIGEANPEWERKTAAQVC